MIRCLTVLALFSLARGAGSIAVADVPTSEEVTGTQIEELSDRLQQVLGVAANAGLIDAQSSRQVRQPADIQFPQSASSSVHEGICAGTYLDFGALSETRSYSDILQYQAAKQQDIASGATSIDYELIRLKIALGLNAEALMSLQQTTEAQATALMHFIGLMEGRDTPHTPFFSAAAQCHRAAGLWLAIALLTEDDLRGAEMLETHIADFRRLPFELRVATVAIAVPALGRLERSTLARKLLASFTESDLARTDRLKFSLALLDMGVGQEEAKATVHNALIMAEYQLDALSALHQHGQALPPNHKRILMDGVTKAIGQAQNDREVGVRLRFALEALSARADYEVMQGMAALPALQNELAQAQIKSHLFNGLKRDLRSDMPLRKMAAINALLQAAEILDDDPATEALFVAAKAYAEEIGYTELTHQLANHIEQLPQQPHPGAAIAVALEAKDYQRVYELAGRAPADPHVALEAAIAAIRDGNTAQLAKYETYLGSDPLIALSLIEEDAAGAAWLVSDRVFDGLVGVTDPKLRRRIDRVLALRQVEAARESAPPVIGLRSASDILGRSRAAINALNGGDT